MSKIHYIVGTIPACYHARHKRMSANMHQVTCVNCLKGLIKFNPNAWDTKQQLVNSMSKNNWKRNILQQLIDVHNLSGQP